MENGFSSDLEVTLPHTTIPSWPCLFSGLDIEELGFFSFIHPFKGMFNSNVWKERSIFSREDLRVFILNVPGTYPAWRVNGEMITGILSPSISCFPKELEFILKKNWIIEGKTISEIFKAFELKSRLFLKKMKEDFDLMVFVIRVPDSVSHYCVNDEKSGINYLNLGYKKIDDFLGKIIEQNNFDNLLIFSDHGLKFYRKVFHITRWLEKKGLLFLNNNRERKFNSIKLKLYDFLRPFLKTQFSKKYFGKILDINKRDLQKKMDRKLNFFDKSNPRSFVQKLTANVGGIFLFGKDKNKKEDIKKELEKNKDIERILHFDISGFPDFIIVLKEKYILTNEPSYFIKRRTETYSHINTGFFLAYGKDIKKGKRKFVNYKDIAPTILKLVKNEKSNYMKGKILNIFKE